MPAQSVRIDEQTGEVMGVRGNGEPFSFNLNDIPGNGWPSGRLQKLQDRIQEFFDTRFRESDLPVDEPIRTMGDAELFAKYGNRCFRDGQDIVCRATKVTITHDGTRLNWRTERVR